MTRYFFCRHHPLVPRKCSSLFKSEPGTTLLNRLGATATIITILHLVGLTSFEIFPLEQKAINKTKASRRALLLETLPPMSCKSRRFTSSRYFTPTQINFSTTDNLYSSNFVDAAGARRQERFWQPVEAAQVEGSLRFLAGRFWRCYGAWARAR